MCREYGINFLPVLQHFRQLMVDIFKRKLKDLAASCYNCLQEWQESVQRNKALVEQIGERRITLLKEEESDEDGEEKNGNANAQPLEPDQQLTELSSKLIEVVSEFEKRCSKIDKIRTDLVALRDYASATGLDTDALIGVCRFDHLLQLIADLQCCCIREVQSKRAVAQEIAFAPSKDFVVMCIAAWIYEPCLETGLVCRVSCMLRIFSEAL